MHDHIVTVFAFLLLVIKGGRGRVLARPFVASGASYSEWSEPRRAKRGKGSDASGRVPETRD